jgi:aspartate kinase
MLNAYGFLRKVFEIFEKHKTPIDLITTSEVSVSVTIDDDKQLFEILNELKDFGTVEVDRNQSIICIVGDFLAANKGIVAQILNSINEIPLRMVSYGGSDNNISLLLNCDDKIRTLKLLNSRLFTKQVDEIFKQN